MADQQNRGGKKVGTREPDNTDKQQKGRDSAERPAKGQPGGPKPSADKTRHEQHK
jgi:hypothetical protein